MAVIVSESISGSDWSDNVLTESENCIGMEQTNGADCHTIQNKKQKLSLIAKAQWLASNPTLKITAGNCQISEQNEVGCSLSI